MPLSYAELEKFYEGLVARARRRGIACAITSGMSCVAYGVAQATQDCDLLCAPEGAGKFLCLLEEANLRGHLPSYRGHLSPRLDTRWLRGGWTSHFVWEAAGAQAYLDIFGVAPRGSSPWEAELQGFYAGPHTVAEMKPPRPEPKPPALSLAEHSSGCRTCGDALQVCQNERNKGKTCLAHAGGPQASQAGGIRLPRPRLWRRDGARQLPPPRPTPPLCRGYGGSRGPQGCEGR